MLMSLKTLLFRSNKRKLNWQKKCYKKEKNIFLNERYYERFQ